MDTGVWIWIWGNKDANWVVNADGRRRSWRCRFSWLRLMCFGIGVSLKFFFVSKGLDG